MPPLFQPDFSPRRQFEAAIGPLLPRVLGFLSRRVKDGAAEDLLQEATLQAWREWTSLRNHAAVRAWLFQISLRILQEHLRKNARRDQLVQVVDLEPRFVELIASSSPTSLDILVARASDEEVWQALQSLPRELSLPLELHEVDELSYQEVADVLQVPIGTVMSRIHRARRQLAVVLSDGKREVRARSRKVEHGHE